MAAKKSPARRRKSLPGSKSSLRARDATRPLIVGIGASAGGLAAFTAFFSRMPATSGMAFVVVQHLAPTHKSLLVELLEKHTQIPVAQARDGCRPIPAEAPVSALTSRKPPQVQNAEPD